MHMHVINSYKIVLYLYAVDVIKDTMGLMDAGGRVSFLEISVRVLVGSQARTILVTICILGWDYHWENIEISCYSTGPLQGRISYRIP